MYIPEMFRGRNREQAIEFMRANPFAILVSACAEAPFATHVPVVIRDGIEKMTIRGHVARANPHWEYLRQNPRCLMIFHGPHAYISPANYETRENVPTWNYGAVHAYGDAQVFSTVDQLSGMLHDLIPTFEASYSEQWQSLSEAYRTRMLSHIVGFEIAVTELQSKFKLSQNRAREEQQKVIDTLGAASDTMTSGTAKLMCEHGLGTSKMRNEQG